MLKPLDPTSKGQEKIKHFKLLKTHKRVDDNEGEKDEASIEGEVVITETQTHYEGDQDKFRNQEGLPKKTIQRLQVDGYSKKYREDDLDCED